MGIENLLAQGVQITRPGMEQNALMQYQQFQDAKQKNALMQMQMQDMHAQRQQALQAAQQVAADRARSEQLRQSIPSPQMQASQQALAGGGGPTVGNAAQMRTVDPRLQMLHGAMQAGMGTPMDYMNEAYPKAEPMVVAPGASVIDKRAPGTSLFTAPDKAKQDPFTAMLIAGGIDPASPQGRALIAAKLQKDSTHAPASTMNNFGSPVAGIDPKSGNPAFAVTDKQGNVKVLTDIAPPAKDLPASLKEKLAQNNVTLQKIDKALGLVATNGSSLGAQNIVGDAVMQRVDPSGVELRAMVADIGGQKIHDRSGAAVTVGESARLKPYVPAATDNAATVKTKLGLFRQEYAAMQQEIMSGAGIQQAAAGKASAATVKPSGAKPSISNW